MNEDSARKKDFAWQLSPLIFSQRMFSQSKFAFLQHGYVASSKVCGCGLLKNVANYSKA